MKNIRVLSNYVGMIFLVNLTKDMRKHMEVVKLCWNDFLSKANDKNVIYSGDGSIFFGMNLLVNLTKKVREKLMEVVRLCWNDFLSNLVSCIIFWIKFLLFHYNTLYFPGVFGNFGSLWAYPSAHSGEAKYISIWLERWPGVYV